MKLLIWRRAAGKVYRVVGTQMQGSLTYRTYCAQETRTGTVAFGGSVQYSGAFVGHTQ